MADGEVIFQVVVFSLAVSTISMTLSKTNVFEGLREFLSRKNQWLGELIRCPYCTSHWVSLLFVIIYRLRIIESIFLLDYIVTIFTIVALASFWSLIICCAFREMESLAGRKGGR